MTSLAGDPTVPHAVRRRGARRSIARVLSTVALAAPLTIWLAALVAVPLGILVVYSFWRVVAFQIVHVYSLVNYRASFSRVFLRALENSLVIGLSTAAITCVIAFALAWAIRFRVQRGRNLLLLAIVAASAGSYLARLYAWRGILGAQGAINSFLTAVHLTDAPLGWLIFNRGAVVLALVNLFVPYAFLPIYANLLAVDPEVLEAGRVLGAGPIANLRRVALPLSSVGLATSFVYVLIFATGDFAIPTFLGGPTGLPAAQVIQSQFGEIFNWPLGAAMAIVYLLVLGGISGLLAVYAGRRSRRLAR
jgi:spermidine/putrescine transport system permease protein